MTKPDTATTRSRHERTTPTTPQSGRVRRSHTTTQEARAGEAPTPALPPPIEPGLPPVRPGGKLGKVVDLLRRPGGARIEELMEATGWQSHTVRGAISGALKSRLKLAIISEPGEAGRVYRIAEEVSA